MLHSLVFLLLGLILLVWSADKLVYGSAGLARNLGISPLVIGMTILAMGSSAPEMMVSATAALDGRTDTAIGNVIGSNIANIALILGITAIIKPMMISSGILRRELPLMIGVTLLSGLLLWDNHIAFFEGIILVFMFTLFILAMLRISKAEQNQNKDELIEQHADEIPNDLSNMKAIFWVVLGLILLPIASNLLVDNAVIIAKHFGMSDLVIGLTIIAVGTSLPELAASLAGVLKGEDDLAVGNIIGSNIFNILAVMGIPGLLHPSVLNENIMGRDFWVMLFFSLLLLIMALGKSRSINRIEGAILLCGFIAYQVYLICNLAA